MGTEVGLPTPPRHRPRRAPLAHLHVDEPPLRLKRHTLKPFLLKPTLFEDKKKTKQRISSNAMLGMVMWTFLWLGYNTSADTWNDPNFPADTMALIHGIRCFFPLLAAWIALLCLFVRSRRVMPTLLGPMGLLLLYALTGLVSSATFSPYPPISLFQGAIYLSIVLVLLAIVVVDDPLADFMKVLKLTWVIGTMCTLGLLGIIPLLGSRAMAETTLNPVGKIAYAHVVTIAGMEGSRNTGFARYAAISALVAFCGVMRKSKLYWRLIWFASLGLSLYALVIANGRTETIAFVASFALALCVERSKRFMNLLVASFAALLLGLRGFYSVFYTYITRGASVDSTMTGRTRVWEEGWALLKQSPWVGYGFQADRYYLGWHMHNAFLHVLFQSGFLGGSAILIALFIVWVYIAKYFFFQQPADKSLIPPEIPAVFMFMTLSSFLESTFAYFSAAWLLSAPIVGYVMALHRRVQAESSKTAKEKALQFHATLRRSRIMLPLNDASPAPPVPIAG
jgi:O-antigen ligase